MIFLTIGGGLVVFGGGAVIFAVAEDNDRNGAVWALSAIAGASAAAWLAWRLASRQLADPGVDVALTPVMAVLAAPVLVHTALGLLAARAPARVHLADGRSVPMSNMTGDGGRPCELRLDRDALVLDERSIRWPEITEARVDGECLRLTWRDGAALLFPEGQRTRAQRVRLAESLAAGIEVRRG